MRLAHQTINTTSPQVTSDEVFRWNRVDSSQFTLVDPLAQGWEFAFVPASSELPAHLLLTAPGSWSNSTGPVFLVTSEDLPLERRIDVVHGFFPIDLQLVGPILRFLADDSWVGMWWESNVGIASLVLGAEDNGSPTNTVLEASVLDSASVGSIMKTSCASSGNLYGGGKGCVASYGALSGSEDLHVDQNAGFGVWSLESSGDHGGESIRIFDFAVREGGGRA